MVGLETAQPRGVVLQEPGAGAFAKAWSHAIDKAVGEGLVVLEVHPVKFGAISPKLLSQQFIILLKKYHKISH